MPEYGLCLDVPPTYGGGRFEKYGFKLLVAQQLASHQNALILTASKQCTFPYLQVSVLTPKSFDLSTFGTYMSHDSRSGQFRIISLISLKLGS